MGGVLGVLPRVARINLASSKATWAVNSSMDPRL